jgi:WD40 repeat protein
MTNKILIIAPKEPLLGHQAAIYTLLGVPYDANKIWTAGSDGMVAEWEPLAATDAVLCAKIPETVFCLSAFEHILIAGTMNGGVHFIDIKTKSEIKSVLQHPKGVFDLKTQDHFLFSLGGDGKFTRWDLQALRPIESLVLSQKTLRTMAVCHNICAIAGSDNNIYIINTLYNDTKVVKNILSAHASSIFTLCFSPCGKYLLSGGRDALLKVWDIADDFSLFHVVPAHLFTINDIQYSPDGVYFATASRDKSIKIWSASGFKLLKVIDNFKNGGHFNSVNKLLWLNNSTLCSVSDDRTVRIFEIE